MFKQLQDMALFALVAEMGSFTAAARKAGLPKSSVSQRVSQLEQQVGIRLLNRTTRKLNLTFAGEHYLVHCREMLAASERAEYAIQRLRDNPSGRLRITCPAGIGATLLAHLNADFQRRYPDVSLEVSISDDLLDLVESGFDVALRTGKPQDSSLIGRMIGHCPRYMLASPDYLARCEPLEHPRQLVEHRCITHKAWPEWLLRRESEDYRHLPDNTHISDNLVYARESAIAGAGITLLPAFLLEDKRENGALVQVLPDWNVEGNELWLAYPSRKLNSPALMSYVDFAMQYDEVKRFYVSG
ncbi:LysR family transcriptional regulator [Lelliottia amnigena]|jgi:DNA-binding transcriptional LysR family regulator|uniref:LysR family transcriptional regulator n=1 Tax=Lelliottia amnigena TaxID=61646 RepID=A0AAP2ADB4_LELAM|nr:LysR family transcriptional regulator [Lelliottia amnigena]MBL5898932.1 LysR family transcriptional regulator [Lelliottia amnigena]MBL5931478.1 LysR family transcriptional regulator [Lelliottia amnigena]MBL5934327.1 LysR family transcriptional regulator [Lelliottia amnigena]MBL5966687.1 LysR family transcriptional regulator [Lelliottia amnigena]MCE9964928.1 LysR family transcriptional regulator [Lelliottia amnigena]